MTEGIPTDKNETVPAEDLMDLDFTPKVEVSPAAVAQAEKDKADIAVAQKKAEESYDWDNPNQRRAGLN